MAKTKYPSEPTINLNSHASLTPSQRKVYDYLAQGRTLTNVVALAALGVGSLSSRISELRKFGIQITTEMETGPDGRTFKKYKLANRTE